MWPFKRKVKALENMIADRAFHAAQFNNLLNKWAKTTEQIDADLQRGGHALRARARDMAKNNVYAKKYLNILKTNVVGKDGIRLQCQAKNRNGQLDVSANSLVEQAWQQFCQPGECDVTGRLSIIDAQSLMVLGEARDGEYLIREYDGYKNSFGYALQFIDPDLLDEDHNEDLANGRYIRMGIEYNKNGFPINYHLTPIRNDRVRGKSYRDSRSRSVVPASEIIHGYLQEFSNQSRGFSWMHAAMVEMHHLGAFREAAIIASRIGASNMGFFTEGLEGGSFTGDGKTASGDLQIDIEPGVFRKLPAGVDFKMFDSKYPSDMVDAFEMRSLKGIASGLNISYPVLASDPSSTSYGTMRGFTIDDRDYFRGLQNRLSSLTLQRIYRGFLRNGLKNGSIGLPADRYQKLLEVKWQPRGWQWIDPAKDAAAYKILDEKQMIDEFTIAAERGMDLEEIYQQRAAAKKLREKYKLTETEANNAEA